MRDINGHHYTPRGRIGGIPGNHLATLEERIIDAVASAYRGVERRRLYENFAARTKAGKIIQSSCRAIDKIVAEHLVAKGEMVMTPSCAREQDAILGHARNRLANRPTT